ncbi:hypothetical protein [Aquisphaera insulae]|uniref:hypothetical protein n=1 Tax=Aquisphaera insulae TaxID=2712864 RepID=UPI0013EE0168|nr:hypothetical protein [Aquisphaera insulae]
MERLPRYRQLIGFRHDRVGESSNDRARLRELFAAPIPDDVVEFLATLRDSVLYYRYEVLTRTGKPKAYSHFVATNIGPDSGVHPFPASIIGHVLRYRGMGLPDGYLPLLLDFGKNAWVWYDLHRAAVVVPRGDREFGSAEREWNVIAPGFEDFIGGMTLDLSPLLHPLRVAGLGNVQPSMRTWFASALGDDWEIQVQGLLKRKRKQAEPGAAVDGGGS